MGYGVRAPFLGISFGIRQDPSVMRRDWRRQRGRLKKALKRDREAERVTQVLKEWILEDEARAAGPQVRSGV